MERVGRADGREVGDVVDHCVTNPQRRLAIAKHVPGEACSRAKVAQIEVIQTRVTHPHTDQPRRRITWRTDRWLRRRARIEVRRDLVGFAEGSVDLPAETVTDRQPRPDPPFILEKDAHGGLVEMAGGIAKGTRELIHSAKQQLGKKRRIVSLETAYR